MSAFAANGTRLTASTLTTTPYVDPDPVVTIPQDVYEGFSYPGVDRKQGEQGRRLRWKSGARVRQSEINALLTAAVVDTISPVTGPAAGGTVVTLTGTGLDGVTAVTFGGTAGTAIKINGDGTTVTVTAPAHAAGAVNVVLTDDSGTVTKTGAYTYV